MRTRLLLSAAVLALLAAAPRARPDDAPRFAVIVHPSNAAQSITRKHLSDLFLKKVTRWSDGAGVHPVEPPERSLARAYFLSDVMNGRSAFAMKLFWNRRVLSGREVPPVEKASDDEVVAYVRATPGAIGYVLAATPAAGVKVLALTD
jgi:ABC-type phosphate transport system substrate-binding protein